MSLGIGGFLNYFILGFESGRLADAFVFPIILALLMTISRWLYNGKHPWNMPFEKPSNIKIIGFVLLSFYVVHLMFGNVFVI